MPSGRFQPGPDLTAWVRWAGADDRPFALLADGVWVGGVPLPALLMNWVLRTYDPSFRIASRLPFPVEVGRLTVSHAAIRVSWPR